MDQGTSFGQLVRIRRHALGLTQEELARRVGCAAITVRKIEADDLRPSQQIAERLALALGMPADDRDAFMHLARTAAQHRRTPVSPAQSPLLPSEIGLEDLSGRSVEEQARFFHATHQFLKAFETIHFHYVYGLMDEELWGGWQGLLRHYVAAPGIAHYWKLRPEVFSERFRKFVNALEPPTEQRTVGHLFRQDQKS